MLSQIRSQTKQGAAVNEMQRAVLFGFWLVAQHGVFCCSLFCLLLAVWLFVRCTLPVAFWFCLCISSDSRAVFLVVKGCQGHVRVSWTNFATPSFSNPNRSLKNLVDGVQWKSDLPRSHGRATTKQRRRRTQRRRQVQTADEKAQTVASALLEARSTARTQMPTHKQDDGMLMTLAKERSLST